MAGVLMGVLQDAPCAAPDQRPPRVLLGCSGSVASIKVPLLARLLRDRGAEVVVLPTHQALHFFKQQTEDGTLTQTNKAAVQAMSKPVRQHVQGNTDLNSKTDEVCCNSINTVDSGHVGFEPNKNETISVIKSVNEGNVSLYCYVCAQVYEQEQSRRACAPSPSEGGCQMAGAKAAGGASSVERVCRPNSENRAIIACEWCAVQALYPDLVIAGDVLEWELWRGRGDCVLHVQLRRWADVLLIAPLSANTLAKVAGGLCDNLLTCVVRAWDVRKPLLFCPAMNTLMYEHPLTARHIAALKELGYMEVEAVTKRLVCGDLGSGAMAELETIVRAVLDSSPSLCWSLHH